ncbi:MAG: heavy metal efflux pump, cobalt-zinc-cadmium, partial [Alphaproteobacteria bacterium]|nr:heavy metal efflux pump, cobalt-zinc-cadmium [Alphaproteobacteria bacterium]
VGLVVDDAVIDVENMLRHLRTAPDSLNDKFLKYKILLASSLEVRVPVITATIAVLLISIPVITMSGIGGRLFAPLGIAYAVATLFSLLVALTLTPALCMAFLQEKNPEIPAVTKWLQKKYVAVLDKAQGFPFLLAIIALASVAVMVIGFMTLKTEFLPELHEGHFILHMEAEPGASLDTSMALGNQVTKKLLQLPYITAVVQQTGRTENGIDFWGTQSSEFNIALDEKSGIDEGVAKEEILKSLEEFKNAEFELETFLTERMQEVISGHTSEAALNVYGDDMDTLETVSEKLADYLKTVPGIIDVQRPSKTGTPELSITLNQQALTQWGLDPISVLDTIHTAYQGEVIGQIYDLHHPTDLAVILNEKQRNDIKAIGDLPIATPSGDFVALKDLAYIEQKSGRYLIEHDSGRRVQSVTFNMDKHSKHILLKNLRLEIAKQDIPVGVYTSLVSLSEEEVNSTKQLFIHSAIACIAVVILLSLVMHHQSQIWLVLANTPLALVGGVLALGLTHNSLSLGAIVGFVTLIGITLRNSVLMLAHYAHVVAYENREWTKETAFAASAERLLPILMTAIVTGIGLLPIAMSSGQSGHEIEGPMAIVIIGGLLSSTILNLLFLPILSLRYVAFSNLKI